MSGRESTVAPCALPGTPLAAVRSGIDACVHCGFCLQACPTYLTLDDENDSPRGRIVLMRSMLEGTIALDDEAAQTHLDRCLGCRACETACPSGVPYGHLLEAVRATTAEREGVPLTARVILAVFRRPWLMRLAMAGGRVTRALGLARLLSRLPGRVGFAMAMLESTRPPVLARSGIPTRHEGMPATGVLLSGCVMEGLFTHTNRATARVLAANGCATSTPSGQGCCGALHAHAGDAEGARALARANIAAFEPSGDATIVVNAAGCGAMMKEYGHLLADDPEWAARAALLSARVRDVSEVLAAAGPARSASLPVRATYDAPCHLLHAQRIAAAPLSVLAAVHDLDLVPLDGAEHCCGAAGIYNLIEPATSDAVLAPKLANIAATRAEFVLTGNPGCLMQIGAGLRRVGSPVRAIHPVDLLDAAYARGIQSRDPNRP